MSEVKTNKISPATGTALQIGDASDVITIPTNATITNLGTATGFGGGLVLQVVQNNVNTLGSQSITQNVITNIDNLNCVITPTSASSKILIQVHWFGETNDPQNMMFGIKRDSTAIGSAPHSGASRSYGITAGTESNIGGVDHNSTPGIAFYQFIDAPATTSATTYHATFRDGFAATTLYNNRTQGHGTSGGYETGVSSITLTELSSATVQTNGS